MNWSMMQNMSSKRALSLMSVLACLPRIADAVLPTAAIDVSLSHGASYTILVSQASFGVYPGMKPDQNPSQPLLLAPADNELLCQNVTDPTSTTPGLMLVPRGECTFEQKAFNAQRLGATGIAVYGTLASRYSLNTSRPEDFDYSTDDIIYPQQFFDYDCSKGRSQIPKSDIQMEPLPYNAQTNDAVLSGPNSLCVQNAADGLEQCSSTACLLTGEASGDDSLEACCAWDLHVWLYNDPTFHVGDVTIPAVYLTMSQGQQLLEDMQFGEVQTILYSRYRAKYNPSALLIWALGVSVATLAAYLSAGDYRKATKHILARVQHSESTWDSDVVSVASQDDASPRSRSRSPPIHRDERPLPLPESMGPIYQQPEDSLELSAEHAFGFIIMASSGLFILFFFKIYNVVKVMYTFGCSKAVTQVLFTPIVSRVAKYLNLRNKIVWRTNTEDFGDITRHDIVASIFGFGLGLAWLIVAFTVRHPESVTFFWVTQDIMGSCMCIMFLSLIKLNSIRVASILLLVAFFYDIFFVFVTPLLFKGQSVMITVATSGGPPKADPSWCEKYPDDANCQGGDPLPMLLTVPRIGDYQGGASLLGLGDIVLPGLLLSFAARLDAAKQLLGIIGGGNGVPHSYTCPEDRCCGGLRLCNGGYFAPLVVAYAVGLLMANAAVYIMNMGQPALLYLVPCCLGTVVFMGWKRNELNGLWHGPKAIRTADAVLYGEMDADPGHSPLPTDEGMDIVAAPSAQDGDVPLLNVT